MQYYFTQCFLASLAALAPFVRADYAIDDQNTTSLLYSANPGGSRWLPYHGGKGFTFILPNGTGMTALASNCYNSTYTIVGCTNAANCKAQIPFSGSGITIYILQAGVRGTNASLTIDEGAPTYSVLDPPPGPNYYVPNVALFSVQGMTTGDHTATMAVLNWDNASGYMMFDYALINQTIISAPTTIPPSMAISSSMTISPSMTISSSTIRTSISGGLASTTALVTTIPETTAMSAMPGVLPLKVGAIVGGTLGALAALILAVFYFRRRYHKAHAFGTGDYVELTSASAIQRPPSSMQYTTVSGHARGESTVMGFVSTQAPTQSTSSRSSRTDKSLLSVTNPNKSQLAEPVILAPVRGTPSGMLSETSHIRIQQAHPSLTDDQVDFVNYLYAHDVPATAVARVIEQMMAGEQHPAVDGCDSLPPPSYYHTNNG